jgi:hypothetical protein
MPRPSHDSFYLTNYFSVTLQYACTYFTVHSRFHLNTPRHRNSLTASAHLSRIPLYSSFYQNTLFTIPEEFIPGHVLLRFPTATAHPQWMVPLHGRPWDHLRYKLSSRHGSPTDLPRYML